MTRGRLIAFEGLDQSGKQTQALRLRQALETEGLTVVSFDFPDYQTPIGQEIGAALKGERAFPPDCLQLLYVANRCEHRPRDRGRAGGGAVGRVRPLPGLVDRVWRGPGARPGVARPDPARSCRPRT